MTTPPLPPSLERTSDDRITVVADELGPAAVATLRSDPRLVTVQFKGMPPEPLLRALDAEVLAARPEIVVRFYDAAKLAPVALLGHARHLVFSEAYVDPGARGVLDVAPVAALSELRTLTLSLSRITDLGPLGCSVADLTFVGSLTNLEELELSYLASVTRLPALAALSSLRRLEIFGLKNLADVSTLSDARALQHFSINQTKRFVPSDFRLLARMPALRVASVNFGSLARDAEFDSLLAELGLRRHE